MARIPIVPVARSITARCGLHERGVGQHVEDVPGPPFLHRDRADPGVECPDLECGGNGEAQLLSRDVVEVRLQQERALSGADRRNVGVPADHDLGAVREVVHFAGAAAESR